MIPDIIAMLTLFLSMILQVIIPPIPAELIVIGAGKAYGITATTIVAGTGLYIGSVLVYFIGKYIHKSFERFFNQKKVKKAIKRLHEFETFILLIRVFPYNPSDVISYAAGIIKVKTRKFVIMSLFTSYIRTFLLAYLGSQITSIATLLTISTLLLISAILTYAFIFTQPKN